jgi:hypothetical protein
MAQGELKMQHQADAVAVKIAATVTQTGAAGAIYFGLTLNEIGVIVGIAVGVIGLIGQLGLTWYYKHQHLQLARKKRAADNDQ